MTGEGVEGAADAGVEGRCVTVTRARGVFEALRVVLGEGGEGEDKEEREDAKRDAQERRHGDVPIPHLMAALLPSDESLTFPFLSALRRDDRPQSTGTEPVLSRSGRAKTGS